MSEADSHAAAKPAEVQPKDGHGPEAGAAPAKPRAVWVVRLERHLKVIWLNFLSVLGGLGSSDKATRRMARVFVLCLFGLLLVSVQAWRHYRDVRGQKAAEESAAGKNLGSFLERQAELNKRKVAMVVLGYFTLELKRGPNSREAPGVINMAEVELYAECDSGETCDYIQEALPQARNQVTNVFVPVDREELTSREGRARLKSLIIERLNTWLPHGRVRDVYFSRVVVS